MDEANVVREWLQKYLFGATGDEPSYTDMRNEYTKTLAMALGYGSGGGYINYPDEYLELKEMVDDKIPTGEILRRIMIEYGHETDPGSEAQFEAIIAKKFDKRLKTSGVSGSWGEFMGTYSPAQPTSSPAALGRVLGQEPEYPTAEAAMADSDEDAAFAAANVRNRKDRLEQVESDIGGLSSIVQAITQQILSETQPTSKPKSPASQSKGSM